MRVLLLAVLVACSNDPKPSLQSGSAASISQSKRGGSAGGFAAGMAGDLAHEPGGAPITAPPPVSPVPAGSGSAAGSAVAAAKPVDPTPAPPPTPPPAPTPGSAAATPPPAPAPSSAPRVAVKPPPELAQIKLDLEPNWDRDVGEAGTISFVLKVPNTNDTHVFVFHYSPDDPKAPASCEDYKKWLVDGKRLNVTLDRQRNGACYFEGTDDKGVAVFRVHVTYGGKPLVCGGPQYKDAASNQLGDLRDKVVAAAKQICGTLAL